MNIQTLEDALRKLPKLRGATETVIRRHAAMLAIARFGPKQAPLQAFTRYTPDFLAERIAWLTANDQLLTGVLSPNYLRVALGTEGEPLIREFLGLEDARTPPPPQVKSKGRQPAPRPLSQEPLDLASANLQTIQDYCSRNGLVSSRYSEFSPRQKQIYNRKTMLLREAKKAQPAPPSQPDDAGESKGLRVPSQLSSAMYVQPAHVMPCAPPASTAPDLDITPKTALAQSLDCDCGICDFCNGRRSSTPAPAAHSVAFEPQDLRLLATRIQQARQAILQLPAWVATGLGTEILTRFEICERTIALAQQKGA